MVKKVKEYVDRDCLGRLWRARRQCGDIHKSIVVGAETDQSQVLAAKFQARAKRVYDGAAATT